MDFWKRGKKDTIFIVHDNTSDFGSEIRSRFPDAKVFGIKNIDIFGSYEIISPFDRFYDKIFLTPIIYREYMVENLKGFDIAVGEFPEHTAKAVVTEDEFLRSDIDRLLQQ